MGEGPGKVNNAMRSFVCGVGAHPVKILHRQVRRIPRVLSIYSAFLIGGVIGVVFTLVALSAFLFQILSAISTGVLALATLVLALSTLSLYRQTRVLAEIETKRDLRSNLERRIQLGDTIVHTNSYMILNPLRDETGLALVQITKEWS